MLTPVRTGADEFISDIQGMIGGSFSMSGRLLALSLLSPEHECRLGNLFDAVDGSMLQEPRWLFSGEHGAPLN